MDANKRRTTTTIRTIGWLLQTEPQLRMTIANMNLAGVNADIISYELLVSVAVTIATYKELAWFLQCTVRKNLGLCFGTDLDAARDEVVKLMLARHDALMKKTAAHHKKDEEEIIVQPQSLSAAKAAVIKLARVDVIFFDGDELQRLLQVGLLFGDEPNSSGGDTDDDDENDTPAHCVTCEFLTFDREELWNHFQSESHQLKEAEAKNLKARSNDWAYEFIRKHSDKARAEREALARKQEDRKAQEHRRLLRAHEDSHKHGTDFMMRDERLEPYAHPALYDETMDFACIDDFDICMHHLAGQCHFKDRCKKTHLGPEEANALRRRMASQLCKYGVNCTRKEHCLYFHGDRKGGDDDGDNDSE